MRRAGEVPVGEVFVAETELVLIDRSALEQRHEFRCFRLRGIGAQFTASDQEGHGFLPQFFVVLACNGEGFQGATAHVEGLHAHGGEAFVAGLMIERDAQRIEVCRSQRAPDEVLVRHLRQKTTVVLF